MTVAFLTNCKFRPIYRINDRYLSQRIQELSKYLLIYKKKTIKLLSEPLTHSEFQTMISLLGNTGRMEDLLLSMDSQLRLYLWTIREMNALQCAAQLHNSARNQIYNKGVSHYKKRWRDRYIKPDSSPLNFEGMSYLRINQISIDINFISICYQMSDPLKKMNHLVNDCRTYDHVMAFKRVLTHIVEEPNPVQQILGKNYLQLY